MENASHPTLDPISQDIWDMKYRFKPATAQVSNTRLKTAGAGSRRQLLLLNIQRTSNIGLRPSSGSCRTIGSCRPAGSWRVPAPIGR